MKLFGVCFKIATSSLCIICLVFIFSCSFLHLFYHNGYVAMEIEYGRWAYFSLVKM